jgi:hypothetical protein
MGQKKDDGPNTVAQCELSRAMAVAVEKYPGPKTTWLKRYRGEMTVTGLPEVTLI